MYFKKNFFKVLVCLFLRNEIFSKSPICWTDKISSVLVEGGMGGGPGDLPLGLPSVPLRLLHGIPKTPKEHSANY